MSTTTGQEKNEAARKQLERLRRMAEDENEVLQVLHDYNLNLLERGHLRRPDDMSEDEHLQWCLAEFLCFDIDLLRLGCELEGVELTEGSLFVHEDEEAA